MTWSHQWSKWWGSGVSQQSRRSGVKHGRVSREVATVTMPTCAEGTLAPAAELWTQAGGRPGGGEFWQGRISLQPAAKLVSLGFRGRSIAQLE